MNNMSLILMSMCTYFGSIYINKLNVNLNYFTFSC